MNRLRLILLSTIWISHLSGIPFLKKNFDKYKNMAYSVKRKTIQHSRTFFENRENRNQAIAGGLLCIIGLWIEYNQHNKDKTPLFLP